MKKTILIILFALLYNPITADEYAAYNFFKPDTSGTDSIQATTDSLKSDSDSLRDSLKSKRSKENRPAYLKPYLENYIYGSEITQEMYQHSDYRYTGNILEHLPFSFLQDLGVTGQPSELLIFGLGNGSISHNIDGLQRNNRWKNSFNLYHIQSELIDSIEQVPLTSGFLYNTQNNPVQVNYITRNNTTKRPYSRIRFYQAPNEEGLLDVIFTAPVFNRTYLYVQATNTSMDPLGNQSNPKFNNDFSLWNVESKLRYLLADKITISAGYNHVKENTELYGGVKKAATMYNVNDAILNYYYRSQRITRNDYQVSLTAEFIKDSPLLLSGYYQYNLQEFNSNVDSLDGNTPSFEHDNEYKTYGLYGRQILKYGIFDLDLIGNYEHTEYATELFGNITGDNVLSAASRLSLNLLNAIKPSVYAKTSNYRKVQFTGFGIESFIEFSNSVRLFGGFSFVEKPFSLIEDKLMADDIKISKQKLKMMELKAEYRSSLIKGAIGYFYFKNDNMPFPVIKKQNDSLLINEISSFETAPSERSGLNITLSFRYWKLLITNNTSLYLDNKSNKYNSLPEYSMRGGVYYVDTLFNENLYLKAGINYSLSGKKSFVSYDFEKLLPSYFSKIENESGLNPISTEITPVSKQIDLFVAGTIQKNAIIYLVYENILSDDYYIIPYYPVYRQGLRIGVSWEFFD